MARLTEREVDLIRQARANSPLGEWVNAQKLIEEAHRLRAAYMADKTRKGLEIIARTTGLAAAARAVATWVVHPLRQALLHQRTVSALRQLDDHLLQDVGLTRDTIENYTGHPARHHEPAAQSRPGLRARLWRWWQHRVTLRKLEALDDRLLADIGLTRGTIAQAVRGLDPATSSEAAASAPAVSAGLETVDALRQWNLSRQAAAQMARLDPDVLSDLGYVKGDVDWVPEVLAKRRLHRGHAN